MCDDIETFGSLREAMDSLENRANNVDGSTPCVEKEECQIWAWRERPAKLEDRYPQIIIRLNKRGRAIVER
jgi:hypothetical protein